MSFAQMPGITQPEDVARGISSFPFALRWNQSPITQEQLKTRAAEALQTVDAKYDKDVFDVKILEINVPQQFVQLAVRGNFSSQQEAKNFVDDIKREFGEI